MIKSNTFIFTTTVSLPLKQFTVPEVLYETSISDHNTQYNSLQEEHKNYSDTEYLQMPLYHFEREGVRT